MPEFLLSCLAYLGVAVPGSTLGLLWPSMRVSIHEPVGALGIVLFAGVITSAVSSAATGRLLARVPAGPLLVTALLADGLGWRLALRSMALVLAVVALVLAAARHRWKVPAAPAEPPSSPERRGPAPRRLAIFSGVVFTAVETGVESAAGIWGYVFLTSGRGLPAVAAGVVVSAYWAMMFAGRVLLGALAQRAGTSRVLAFAVTCVPVGAALMTVPGPAFVAVTGMMLLGLAAAPVFPLLTLTTADRVGPRDASATVGLQVAASAVGSAALPSGIGLAIGAVSARALGPSLLVLALAMGAVYWAALRSR